MMFNPLKILVPTFFILSSSAAIAGSTPSWEYQGIASTGEEVYLDVNSIYPHDRSGAFLDYLIGNDQRDAYTPCNGRFQVVEANGNYGPLQEPQSEAIRKMLDRACALARLAIRNRQ